MKRGEILDAVKQTITKDRNNRHGEPENSFPLIAEEWSRYLAPFAPDGWLELKPSDVAEMLAIFKGVRFRVQPDNYDNEHDRIGYFAIAAELRAAERASQSVKFDPPPPFVAPGSESPELLHPDEIHPRAPDKTRGWTFEHEKKYRQRMYDNAPKEELERCLMIEANGVLLSPSPKHHKSLQADENWPEGETGDIIETNDRPFRYYVLGNDGVLWEPYEPQA